MGILSVQNYSRTLTFFCCISFLLVSCFLSRGNNLQMDDANSLKYALIHMPYLEILDLSDNPIEDEGIKSVCFLFSPVLSITVISSNKVNDFSGVLSPIWSMLLKDILSFPI